MELFLCELYSDSDYRTLVVGVFSTRDKAQTAGDAALQQNASDFSAVLVKPCTLDTPV